MPRPKRSIQTTTTIDGCALIWRLHREEQWGSGEAPRGVEIHVKAAEGTFRELFLEYPPSRTQKDGFGRNQPVQRTIVAKKVEAHIRQAIGAGWDPGSRGSKPFVFAVDDLPG